MGQLFSWFRNTGNDDDQYVPGQTDIEDTSSTVESVDGESSEGESSEIECIHMASHAPIPPMQMRPLRPLRPLRPMPPMSTMSQRPSISEPEKEMEEYEKEMEEYEKKIGVYDKEMEDYYKEMEDYDKEMEDYGMSFKAMPRRSESDEESASGYGSRPERKEMENPHKTLSWNNCIERRSEEFASVLVENKIMPTKNELNDACHLFGKKSQILSDICAMISKYIKTSSHYVIDVCPSYQIDNAYSENSVAIVFVITVQKNCTFSNEINYDYYIKIEHDVSTEDEIVVSKSNEHTKGTKLNVSPNDDEDNILKKMRICINKNANDLLEKHSNLNVILPSLWKSTGYRLNRHEVKPEPCISLYVTVKGYIPLNEDPFVNQLDGFKTDVIEGEFEPYIGGPREYHEKIKIGLAIHADFIEEGTLGGFIYHPEHGLCGITCAHVIFNPMELQDIKAKKPCRSKVVFQPCGDKSKAFGTTVEAIFDDGNSSVPGMDVALIKIESRHPHDGSFPEAFNDRDSGFDERNPLLFNSGMVCETSDLKRRSVVYKFGITTGITRGSFDLQGAVICKRPMKGQHKGFGFDLKDQIVILRIGDSPFAEPGDSGSLVLMEGNQDSIAIGIVAGGMKGRIFVTPICDILRAFKCRDISMHRFENKDRSQTNPDVHEEMEL